VIFSTFAFAINASQERHTNSKVVAQRNRIKQIINKVKSNIKIQKPARAHILLNVAKQRSLVNTRIKAIKAKRVELIRCRNNSTENCQEIKKQIKTEIREALSNYYERMLTILESNKEKIQNTNLSEEVKTRLISNLDAKIVALEKAKEEYEKLGDNPSKEDLKNARKEARRLWKEAKEQIKLNNIDFVVFRFGVLIDNIKKLETRLRNHLDVMQEKGYDISKIDYDSFSKKIEEAENNYNSARSSEDYADKIQNLRASKKALKEARVNLRHIISQIKDAKKQIKEKIKTAKEKGGDEE